MKPIFAVAGVQMTLSGSEPNVQSMTDRLDMLMHVYPWTQMVVFSELAPYGWDLCHADKFLETEAHFQDLAHQHKIWLLPGTMFEREGDRYYNTASIIDPSGNVVGRYRKLFPFFPYEEGVTGGDQFLVFDVPDVGRFGVSICYDIWMPETSRQMAAMGVEVILHPTLTSSIERDVELAIVRATAAQQQCFVFDVNGLGDGGIGHSIVVANNGDILHNCGAGEGLFPVPLNIPAVRIGRQLGLKGLGQPLKSFRDRAVRFPVYDEGWRGRGYLDELGPLVKPTHQEFPAHRGPFVRKLGESGGA